MKSIFKIFFLVILVLGVVSCTSSKPKSTSSKSNINKQTQTQASTPIVKEYKGIIMHSTAEGDCEYVIALEDKRTVMFDPVNMLGNFKENGKRVWFTFRALKMPNRCEKANPISLTDIRERTVVESNKKPSEE